MKHILLVVLLFAHYAASKEPQFYDVKSLMVFEKVDIPAKLITFSGKQFSYNMLDVEDTYFDERNLSKSLKNLRKGEKIFVTFRTFNPKLKGYKSLKMKDYIVIVSKNRDAI